MVMYKLEVKLVNNKMIYSILLANTFAEVFELMEDFLKDKKYKDINFELIEED